MRPRVLLAILLLMLGGAAAAPARAARPEGIELKAKGGVLGRLAVIGGDGGGLFVSAERLASLLNGRWVVNGGRGILRVGSRSAQFVRDQPRVVVHGQPLTLEASARVGASGWLLPSDFLAKGLGRLAPGVTAVAVAPEPPGPSPPPAAQETVIPFEALRFRSYPSFTRVVVETGGMLSYAVVTGGQEIRVRLPRLTLAGARIEALGDGLVKEIRLEPTARDAVLRVLLEAIPREVRDFPLQDPFRLVLDIYRPREEAPGARGGLEPLRLIVLDAGHGGHDPGAVGPGGVQEKEVVLDVTRRVARLLEESDLGVKVALTRSTDAFVPLRDRTNFANKQRADLFVSIHANAHPRAVSAGVEAYFLSSEASDSEARQVAAIENGVIQLEQPAGRDKGDVLKTILWDLAQSEFQQESSAVAETMLDSMTASLRLVNRGVKQAGFFVLGGAAMPAVLIEIGFLTNRSEERKLATPAYRESVARAIHAGLVEYKRRWDQRLKTAQQRPPREAGR